jgi:predicted amidohydrolase
LPENKERLIRVAVIQRGPAVEDKQTNLNNNLRLIDEAARENPDYILLNELSTTPYFCATQNSRHFDWAEHIPGPSTQAVAQKALEHRCCIVFPLFEKGPLEGMYYNSAVVIGPDGNIIQGVLPDGSRVDRFAKVHLPRIEVVKPESILRMDEPYYFSAGPGFPVFHTPKATIGVLICYDRRIPESWRCLALQGAEVVFIPSDCPALFPERGAASEEMFVAELQTMALQNELWVVTANMGGHETCGGVTTQFYGRSCIIHPSGAVVAQAPSTEPALLSETIDLEENNRLRRLIPLFRDRRPELYGLLTKET